MLAGLSSSACMPPPYTTIAYTHTLYHTSIFAPACIHVVAGHPAVCQHATDARIHPLPYRPPDPPCAGLTTPSPSVHLTWWQTKYMKMASGSGSRACSSSCRLAGRATSPSSGRLMCGSRRRKHCCWRRCALSTGCDDCGQWYGMVWWGDTASSYGLYQLGVLGNVT